MSSTPPFERLKQDVRSALERAETKPVVIAGAGITGRSAARTFLDAGFAVWLIDEKPISDATRSELPSAHFVESFGAPDGGALPEDFPSTPAFVLSSPGINPRSKFWRRLEQFGAPMFSELDLAFPFLGMPDIAVTGTNGKTTVVTLIAEMLTSSGFEAQLVGNVGYPFLGKISAESLRKGPPPAEDGTVDWVAELSSYQLETVRVVAPKVAVLLNIDDDHLERHGSLEAYLAAKARIFEHQTESCFSILNRDEPWSARLSETCGGKPVWFGSFDSRQPADGCFHDASTAQLVFVNGGRSETYSLKNTKLLGTHNKLNLAAAVAAARFFGVKAEAVQKVIDAFTPLEHRVEMVSVVDGVHFINDSKGTNVSSVRVALDMVADEFSSGKVVLLVGGKMKDGAWDSVKVRLPVLARSVVGFGADGNAVLDRLGLSIGDGEPFSVSCTDTLERAVEIAREQAWPGDVVLFSPGCASFDAYSDFGARGRHFKEIVRAFPRDGNAKGEVK